MLLRNATQQRNKITWCTVDTRVTMVYSIHHSNNAISGDTDMTTFGSILLIFVVASMTGDLLGVWFGTHNH